MKSAVIGLDRKLERGWLDAVLERAGQGDKPEQVRAFLDEALTSDHPGAAHRAKTVAKLLRVWVSVPPEVVPLRDAAIQLMPDIEAGERLWLHWGMLGLAYPFFRDVAEAVGRLLTLQEDFTIAQVRSRLANIWGERPTLERATRDVLASMTDWGMVKAGKRGSFLATDKLTTKSVALQLWELEAALRGQSGEEIEVQQLLRTPSLFPFRMTVSLREVRGYDRFLVHRQGIDMDMVSLRDERPRPTTYKPADLFDRAEVNGSPDGTGVSPVLMPEPEKVGVGEEERPQAGRLCNEMVRGYWGKVGGTLLPELEIVPASEQGEAQTVSAVILPDGRTVEPGPEERIPGILRGQHVVVVEANPGRLTRELLGRAVFAGALVRRLLPRSIRVVALCAEDDANLRELLLAFPHVEVEIVGS